VIFYLAAFWFLSCLLLGGGTRPGHLSDAILQLLSIPILLAALWRLLQAPRNRDTRLALAFCGAVLAVPLMQLIPLPPALWTHLPGRETVSGAFELVGRRPGWAPISMAPQLSWLSALSLLPPLAVFFAVLTLDWRERRLLSLLAIAVGMASAFLGLTQLAQGPISPLRFFAVTNSNDAVGFFANRNHFAALLYSASLLAMAWVVIGVGALRFKSGQGRYDVAAASIIGTIAASVALLVLLAAEVTTRSRAGIILTLVALIGGLALSGAPPRQFKHLASTRLILAIVALTLVFLGHSALLRLLDRFGGDSLTDDARIAFARNTVAAAWALMPMGAGLGAFVPVYTMFEKPHDLLWRVYANHAHNDLLELWLETGVAGPLILCLFLYWLVRKAAQAWGPSNPGPLAIDKSLIRAAIVIIALLLCHSLVDYPLRTGAMLAMLAYACGLLIDPAVAPVAAKPVAPAGDAGEARHRSVDPSQRGFRRRDDADWRDRLSCRHRR
jgi:O-antigen ligase